MPPQATGSRKKRGPPTLPRPTFAEMIEAQIRAGTTGIENAALQTGLSRATLQRYLKAEGTSYSRELEQVRQKMACEMLAQSGDSISDVAAALGYPHVGNFTRAFTRWMGVSPSAYRD